MKMRARAAFTLVELLIGASLASALGVIVYGIASEGLTAFARNTSINRSYYTARQTLDRIAINMQSAGHTPLLIDAAGTSTSATPAAGIRFWRYGSSPLYYITTPALTATQLTLNLIKPGTTATVLAPPAVGDMITIAALGFQAQVINVTASGTTAIVKFSTTIVANTSPVLTATALAKATGQLSCLSWTSVAFIAVGSQMRYFPTFVSGTTDVNASANYQVLGNLITAIGKTTPPLPFSLGPSPSINIDLYSEAPDYNNRDSSSSTTTVNGATAINSANTYSFVSTALAPRNPAILRTPY